MRSLVFTFLLFSFIHRALSGDPISMSAYAVDTRTGAVLIDEHSDLSLIPASCLKIVTTAAALSLLGENTRFETHLEQDGQMDDAGVLKGNLYIRGGGDPCLGSDRISGSLGWKEQIEAWALKVVQAGIRSIEGSLIADDSRWEKAMAVSSWLWEDLGNYYGAGASALSFHENWYLLTFKPGKQIGDPTRILHIDPPIQALQIHNEVKTGPQGSGDQACIYGSELSFSQRVQGTIPASVEEFAIKGALPQPAACLSELLSTSLMAKGVSIQNKKIQASKRTNLLTTHSPTVRQIVYHTNRNSINLYAEHLLKKMGEVCYQEGSTQAGLRALTQFCQDHQVDLTGWHVCDGSGLSRKNLVTTKSLTNLLVYMKKSPLFPQFFDSLPQLEEGIHAKSGTMKLVKGYAGYSGEIAFSILINNCSDSDTVNRHIENFFLRLKELSSPISKKAQSL